MSGFIGTKLTMNLGERSYDIILKNGALENLYQFARLDRRVAVVTDAGVPAEYAQRVADQCRDAKIITVPQGEASKSMKILESVLRQMLDAHAAFLRNNPSYKVTVEGHADERGTPEYNIALGERRANAVKMYLQGKGVSADQISIVSYGKEKPAVLGHDEAAYAKNRRAVLVY